MCIIIHYKYSALLMCLSIYIKICCHVLCMHYNRIQSKMEYLKVLKDFNVKLITSLPMKDVVFLATLNQKGLFSGNIKAELKAKSTSTEAADYFLDHKIEKDLANGNNDSFLQLLSAMEEYNTSLKPLVTEINQVLTAVVVLPVASKGEESLDVASEYPINKYVHVNILLALSVGIYRAVWYSRDHERPTKTLTGNSL